MQLVLREFPQLHFCAHGLEEMVLSSLAAFHFAIPTAFCLLLTVDLFVHAFTVLHHPLMILWVTYALRCIAFVRRGQRIACSEMRRVFFLFGQQLTHILLYVFADMRILKNAVMLPFVLQGQA